MKHDGPSSLSNVHLYYGTISDRVRSAPLQQLQRNRILYGYRCDLIGLFQHRADSGKDDEFKQVTLVLKSLHEQREYGLIRNTEVALSTVPGNRLQ
jgi:hypothetical protein